MIKILAIPLLLSALCSCDLIVESNTPQPNSTVTRTDAESRYAKHCMKSDTISKPLLREFNEMTVDRIDGFANGCESQERNKPK